MTVMNYLLSEEMKYERGMALHYMTLFALVRGIEATHTLEFGAGVSTRVMCDAMVPTGGKHISLSTEAQHALDLGPYGRWPPRERWQHYKGLSVDTLPRALSERLGALDVVLHDGAHDAKTLTHDLVTVLPCVRHHGLVLIHDTLHSYVGPEMRAGLVAALEGSLGKTLDYEMLTLPYGFGLTMLRIFNERSPVVTLTRKKLDSPHVTDVRDMRRDS